MPYRHPAVTEQRDDRSPFAVAMEWTSRTTTISLELLVPTCFGYWLDQRLGTKGLFVILGTILGFVTALVSLWHLQKPTGPHQPPD